MSQPKGGIAGIGHTGIGFVAVYDRITGAGLDQTFHGGTSGCRRIIVENDHFHQGLHIGLVQDTGQCTAHPVRTA